MTEQSRQQLAARFRALDEREVSPPIEITVGDYAFYPYRGFSDMLEREDFRKLSQNQLETLDKIASDILAMQRPELFEAFVNDDGVIVVDIAQAHVEYSIDIQYNDARSRVEEIYPQVTYPQGVKPLRVRDGLIRNDTAHEVAHHADYWMDLSGKKARLDYLHSGSALLAWVEELDMLLHPHGVANLIGQVRTAEGYVVEQLLENGYTPKKVDQMLRAEFFAIAGEFYYGSKQDFAGASPLLETYMEQILDLDLEIQRLYIPFEEMEQRRGVLRKAIHAPVSILLGEEKDDFHAMRERFGQCGTQKEKRALAKDIEALILRVIMRLAEEVRQAIKLVAPEK